MNRVAQRAHHGVATAPARRREHNEDASLIGPTWFLVADGMGGHAAGRIASRIVVDAFASRPPIAPVDSTDPDRVRCQAEAAVGEAVDAANEAVLRYAASSGSTGMGSTVAGVTVCAGRPPAVVVFHVGDARCYRLAAGELRLLTRDHSHVQELIDAGRLTTEQARRHSLRNVVTRALGQSPRVVADVTVLDACASRFLLCSDGLTGVVGPQSIGRVLAGVPSPDRAARRLVDLAIDGGAQDDVTALVVDLDPLGLGPTTNPTIGATR